MKEYAVGIDLGGTMIKTGLVLNNQLIASDTLSSPSAEGLAATLPLLKNAIDALLQQQGIHADQLKGIAMGFPGLVNNLSKKILSTNKKYDDAIGIDLESWAKANWNIPLVLENDARVAAVGEWKYGAGKGFNDMVAMTIGTGIGTAAIIEGKLLRGKHFQAGCLGGHISLQYKGRLCTCGNIGCAEAHGSTWSLEETVKGAKDFEHSVLSKSPVINFEMLFAAAAKNDRLASDILHDHMDVWATAIVNLIHAYDPEVVVICGGVMKSADQVIPYIKKKVHAHAWCPWGSVQIKASSLIGDAGILGATYFLSNEL